MWVGYVRVSHVGGRSGESFRSPEDQATAIREWVGRRGESIHVLPPELDESGGNADRPILGEAIAGIESGKWQGLVVAYLSRASRSTRHLLEMWERIESAGGQVVAVAENLDTSTPTGRMQRTMLAAIAEHELDQHRERFVNLREKATAAGIWQRRQTPIGYSRDESTRKLVPNDDAPRVARAFAERVGGKSISAIAVDLDMTSSGTRAVLRNRVYLGELRVGDFVNPEAHPAIVDLPTFEAVQAMRQVRPARSSKHPQLLAGVIRCQSCGHIMRGGTGGGGHRTYQCHGRHSAGRCPHPVGIMQTRVDEYVVAQVLAEMETWGVETQRRADDTQKLRDDLARAQLELSAYLEATEAAGIGRGDFIAGATKRRQAVEAAESALAASARISPLQGLFEFGSEVWESLNHGERNRLLRGVLDAVVVGPASKGARIPVADRCRIFRAGTLNVRYAGGGIAMPVEALPFPPADDERLLGVLRLED